jgi:membrane-associated phospholipid phosphatase
MDELQTPSNELALPIVPRTRTIKVARMVSNAFCPPILAVAGILLVAIQAASMTAWLWSGFVFLIGIITPLSFILYQLKRGHVSDFEIYHREQRKGSYLFTLICGTVSLVVMWIFAAPILIITLGAAALVQVGIMFMINTRWKISAHAASMAVFVTLLVRLFGLPLLPSTVGIPLMVWSRVRLQRHTLMQTIAGSLLGIIVFVLCVLALQQ